MKKVYESKNGIPYANTRLKTKKTVHSSAALMKICHNDPSIVDVCLKIGRYSNNTRKLENDIPKSELTLDCDELNALISFISANYTAVSMGAGEYIEVEEDEASLMRKLKAFAQKYDNLAEVLFESNILTDDVFVAASVLQRRRALEQYERELNCEHTESFWQDWFQKNKWVLGSDYIQIVDERKIDTENIADYLVRAFDGFVDIVEIKKPSGMSFWSKNKDHDNYVPSTELIKAITQCMNYIYAVEQESNSVKFLERVGSKAIKPRCILVFGRSINWTDEQQEAFRILNSAYHQLTILTYDHLLRRAQNMVHPDELMDYENELPF